MVTLGLPLLSQILQSLFALADGERTLVIIASLLGFKSVIDTIRVVTGSAHGGTMNPVACMTVSRGMEITFESIPQTCIQCYRVIKSLSIGGVVSTMQYVAIGSSMLAAGLSGQQ